jgi:hypothetical protein
VVEYITYPRNGYCAYEAYVLGYPVALAATAVCNLGKNKFRSVLWGHDSEHDDNGDECRCMKNACTSVQSMIKLSLIPDY